MLKEKIMVILKKMMLIALCIQGTWVSARNIVTSAADLCKETRKKDSTLAEWTFLTYIAADNSLASYAAYNTNDMSKGVVTGSNSNVLVQWDKPSDNTTWRYKIIPGGKQDVGSLVSNEMGRNPSQELINAMQWVVTKYPAKRYALVLWNHGSGVEDLAPGSTRGILYDDSQNTCLTNQGLVTALTSIKQLLGKNLDLIAMDACLMAMLEVGYEMKDYVDFFVASEETIPGNGFPYSLFLKSLSINPAGTTPTMLAQSMVNSYKKYYTKTQRVADMTLSAMNLSYIDALKDNVDQFITAVNACAAIDSVATKKLIVNARKATLSFEMSEYIDLYAFFNNILSRSKTKNAKSQHILNNITHEARLSTNPRYQTALSALRAVINDGLTKITSVILQSIAGSACTGARGISIYYPISGSIDTSYLQTPFAQDTSWVSFIQAYQP